MKMEKEIKKKTISKKIFLFGILPLLLLGTVFAVGYIVSNLVLTVGVAEPFEVKYNVLGDSGTYTEGTCAGTTEGWFTSTDTNIPTGNFYPMEQRRVCVKIHNLGEADVPYTISATVLNDNQNGDCANAFGTPYELTGNAVALSDSFAGVTVQLSADATPVQGCQVQISVARG
jgi:hypothetical protein